MKRATLANTEIVDPRHTVNSAEQARSCSVSLSPQSSVLSPIAEAVDVGFAYGGRPVLHKVSLGIARGEFMG